MDQVVHGFLAARGGDRRVVLFSDHGTTAVPSRQLDLGKALGEGGFRLKSKLEGRARVEEGLRGYVVDPASVMVSLADGWHYGSRLFDFLATMKGTHGSATLDASVGFVASNVDRLPEVLRAGEVYPYLGLRRPAATPAPYVDRCSPPTP